MSLVLFGGWRKGAPKTAPGKRQNLSVSFLDRRLCRGKQHEEKPGDGRERKRRGAIVSQGLRAACHPTSKNHRAEVKRARVDGEPSLSRITESNGAAQSKNAAGSGAPSQAQKYLGWIEDREASFPLPRIQLIHVNLAFLLRIFTPSVREIFHLQIIFTQS